MVNFIVDDIIRSSYISDNTLYTIQGESEYGIIIDINSGIYTIKWINKESRILSGKENSLLRCYSEQNFKNFAIILSGREFPIQKKAGDNDWIDKDGNHYNDAGDKK